MAGYLEQGYVRIKLKIEPGWDVEPVRAVRERFGDDLLLQVDANTAYTLADARHLAELDPFGLLLIEQPLRRGRRRRPRRAGRPDRRRRSAWTSRSPRLRAAVDAIERGACSVVNIKAGRVGGYLEAVRIHDVCAARGVPVWCGGMLETGVGRAANVALAALPELHPARGHVGLGPVLAPGPHRAVRARGWLPPACLPHQGSVGPIPAFSPR